MAQKRTRGLKLLLERMRERGMNQTQLAELLGIGQPSVSLWLRGLSRPEPHHRTALSLLLDIPDDAWLNAEERKTVDRVRERLEEPAESGPGKIDNGGEQVA